ncbi:hypothetical protein WICPIJ_008445 [Wickerhamomyces pijperi]|uniref:Uncharacterized protein n=1 Tax=Wickerhamomyces pijperi TaxID=599730 RepID=A0A9P8PXK0_WICPI|nr:hypothetical protein WICPIJ_008445 [Wickerhamomyces pijperi]
MESDVLLPVSSALMLVRFCVGPFLLIVSKASLSCLLKSLCLNSQAPSPYSLDCFSSLDCLTLWKSYLFNCLTKLAKLECLKCLGRISFVNSLLSMTTNESPLSVHLTILEYELSSNIRNNFLTKSVDPEVVEDALESGIPKD